MGLLTDAVLSPCLSAPSMYQDASDLLLQFPLSRAAQLFIQNGLSGHFFLAFEAITTAGQANQ